MASSTRLVRTYRHPSPHHTGALIDLSPEPRLPRPVLQGRALMRADNPIPSRTVAEAETAG